MRLQSARRPNPLAAFLRERGRLAWLGYTVLVLWIGAWAHRSGLVGEWAFRARSALEETWVRLSALSRADPEVLRIDMKQEDFMRIAAKREEALGRNLLVSGPDDFVPATIRHDDDQVKARVRLKGDLRDHWAGDKWSYRIDLRGDDTLLGMKRFSIQHPSTREYLWEWLFHRALAREGLPALRYEFVRVIFNGKDLGIYALEEHFDKRLVEHRELREGPIVRFDESASWLEASTQGFLTGEVRQRGGAGAWYAAPVDAFDSARWQEDPAARAEYERALAMLDAFREGRLATSDVFDVPKLARFFALTELIDAPHASGWRNARFYANPVTGKLEPIGFDARGHGGHVLRTLACTASRILPPEAEGVDDFEHAWLDALFADRAFYAAYVAELERVSQPAYLDQMLADLGPDLRAAQDVLNVEFPAIRFWPVPLRKNQAYIRTVLAPAKGLHAWPSGVGHGVLEVEIGNVQYLPVELLAVVCGGARIPLEAPAELAGRDPRRPVAYQRFRFALPSGVQASAEELAAARVAYRLVGASVERSDPFMPGPRPASLLPSDDLLLRASNAREFECLAVEPDGRILFRPGSWRIERDLVLPPGVEVVCGPGTELDLALGAAIVSRSPLDFEGDQDRPIRVRSSGGDGQGLIVLGAQRPSTLRHVVFEGLASPARDGWSVTGAVTFYESPVTIEDCAFRDARAEDALNVVRSSFALVRTLFERTQSDAFDADFCTGRIEGCSFADLTNDGIDVSGSSVEISGVEVVRAGDKGLSVGESSEARAKDVRIADSKIGLASKDLSRLLLTRAEIRGCRYGVAAYRKKSEFGPSSIHAEGLSLAEVGTPYLIEAGSTAEIDGVEIEDSAHAVFELLYGGSAGRP